MAVLEVAAQLCLLDLCHASPSQDCYINIPSAGASQVNESLDNAKCDSWGSSKKKRVLRQIRRASRSSVEKKIGPLFCAKISGRLEDSRKRAYQRPLLHFKRGENAISVEICPKKNISIFFDMKKHELV
jgi:hypothetical protein